MTKLTGYDMRASFNGDEFKCITDVEISESAELYGLRSCDSRERLTRGLSETTFTIHYAMDSDTEYLLTVRKVEDPEKEKDKNMKSIYWLYAVNVDTEKVLYKEPFVGPGDEDAAKQYATLEYSKQIKELGDSKDIRVFVVPVVDFKPKTDD